MERNKNFKSFAVLAAGVGLATMLTLAACSTTVESQPEAAKALESGGTLPPSVIGFLGPESSKLQPGPKGGAALSWVNPNAQWSKYNAILLDPVQFWASADSKVSTADQQVLAGCGKMASFRTRRI